MQVRVLPGVPFFIMTTTQMQMLLNIVMVASFSFIVYIAIDINNKLDELINVYIETSEYEYEYRKARLRVLRELEQLVEDANNTL